MTSDLRRHERRASVLQQTVLPLLIVAFLVVAIPIALLVLFLSDERAEQDEPQD